MGRGEKQVDDQEGLSVRQASGLARLGDWPHWQMASASSKQEVPQGDKQTLDLQTPSNTY